MKILNYTHLFLSFLFVFTFSALLAQTGTVRGNLFDKETGEPIIYGNVLLRGTDMGANSDLDGLFVIANVPEGEYTLVATYLGYDSVTIGVNVRAGGIIYERINMEPSGIDLGVVNVSGRKEQAKNDVAVSKLTVTPKQIRSLPSTGGEADIAQYLTVLPGIIVSGDQGGQLYIRGGSPVQNKILLDGMTIYNPFHSIGFFSVFETEAIRSVDVLTGGFNAEHGGRISAVVDIKTREGNKKRFGGLVSASPFQVKGIFEGPIKKLEDDGGGSTSFLFTGKHSYLDETSKFLYSYATDTSFFSFASGDTSLANVEDIGLPYQYTDLYGKLSFVTGNGTKVNLFGFNFADRFNLLDVVRVNWDARGGGANFRLVPPSSNIILNGTASFTSYEIALQQSDGAPRSSAIDNYNINLNFTYFGLNNQLDYGFEFNGFNTDFQFQNFIGLSFEQRDFTTELSGYVKYKQKIGNLIIEPGFRIQYYASQPALSLEPRVGLKFNATDNLRFKAGAGLYSQNLISTVNEQDIINFFIGFLAGPEERLFKPGSTTEFTDDRLQRSAHAVAGVEIDLTDNIELNVEPYYKRFTQLININRNKLSEQDPDFATETGDAYGIDFSLRYENKSAYIWLTYSLGRVTRDDGFQVYPTVFDRRHNINFLTTYAFGESKSWEASARWNMGSGFPFTLTQGFYQNVPFDDFLLTDILTGNYDLGTILSEDRNDGRLSFYHRLDVSLKKTIEFSKNSRLETTLSVTNAYNRENIFFIDRITNSRVNQLPILPSLGVVFHF